jgi:hypothetical protein
MEDALPAFAQQGPETPTRILLIVRIILKSLTRKKPIYDATYHYERASLQPIFGHMSFINSRGYFFRKFRLSAPRI